MALDGDTPFPFQIHVIKHLCHHFLFTYRIGEFEETVGER
jgi:hypothetical protein